MASRPFSIRTWATFSALVVFATLGMWCSTVVNAVPPTRDQPPTPDAPLIADASDEGQSAIAGFKVDESLSCQLFAAEPQTANPVAFTVDDRGRLYVCESFRQGRGVTDNRKHNKEWLEADLAAMTVADREAYHKRLLGDMISEYTRYDDQVRILEDRDQDGRADYSQVFAKGFNAIVDGTAAGVLEHQGDVFLTCIPHLWRLRDKDGDNQADERDSLSYGYGVRVAFRGHDSHGLIVGPDGRLYFSIGDRGYNIETEDGRELVDPASGAVFRCELDGSKLEVYAIGMRNPQELAFDDYGNLFTGDNNSDSGDKARWVYVVPGGDTGWRMYYQYLGDRGPFNREKIWHPWNKETPAYTIPPIVNFTDGPSGLAYYPGTGLSDKFQGRFLLCDFRGGPAQSGVRSFRVTPNGAFFNMTDEAQPIWNILATDVAFGPDGAIYVSDWVNGWEGEGKGRIYRFVDKSAAKSDMVQEVKHLLAADFGAQEAGELKVLLGHADRRVRLKSQWELARRGAANMLLESAISSEIVLARLHGIWGLGQIARDPKTKNEVSREIWAVVGGLMGDSNEEVRAQACKTMADADPRTMSVEAIRPRLADESPRVRYFAGLLAGAHGVGGYDASLQKLLSDNADEDPIVRHGAIMGLAGATSAKTLATWASHSDRSVRLAATIALRKLKSPLISAYLRDADQQISLEAARAIHDTPIEVAMPALASLIEAPTNSDPLLRRVLNANYRLGGADRAAALAQFAASDYSSERRVDAMEMLANWETPDPRDRVLGAWRPLEPRDEGPAAKAVQHRLPALLAGPPAVQDAATQAAATLEVRDIIPTLSKLVASPSEPPARRAQSLLVLHRLNADDIFSLVKHAVETDVPELRAAARRVWASLDQAEGWEALAHGATAATTIERQDALAAAVEIAKDKKPGTLAQKSAITLFGSQMQALTAGKVPPDTRLDVIEGARQLGGDLADLVEAYEQQLGTDPISKYLACMTGGSAERGQKIFFERTEVSCVRCHKIDQRGGDVGPPLNEIAKEKKRQYLLESIVDPNRAIAKNFESVQVRTDDGVVLSGVLKRETEDTLEMMTVEGRLLTVSKDSIEARKKGRSAMPDDLVKRLTPFELRDLVEYLSTLTAPAAESSSEE